MNDIPILDTLDPKLLSGLTSRREALGKLIKLGTITLSAPVILAALAEDAHGKALPAQVLEVLHFALLLEHLEDQFYDKGMEATGLIPSRYRAVFDRIKKDEDAHVKLLATATASPITFKEFDYTAGGRFPDVFSNFDTFLALAQSFEDTGVRAYKGQAANLMDATLILSIALRIHSVEGRHASEVRRIRGAKGWITGSSRGDLPAFCQPIYNGEGLTTQLGVNVSGIGGTPASAASEAFDEPLTKAQVMAIVDPFIVG